MASSKVCLNASGVETSGTGRPARTITPMPTRASGDREPGMIDPALSNTAIAGTEQMIMS